MNQQQGLSKSFGYTVLVLDASDENEIDELQSRNFKLTRALVESLPDPKGNLQINN